MKKTLLTNITKKVGNFIAQKTKDADNELFTEISEKVIEEFINEIRLDNHVLASWIEEWMKKNTKSTTTNNSYSFGGCTDNLIIDGGCGISKRKKSYSGCGSSGGCYGSGGC